jgi:outer membrane biosynthesis protein TonB
LIVATMLLVGCGGTLPSLQPGASLPDLPSRPTAGPTQKPPAQATEEPPAGQTEKPPKATDKPTQKPPAEQTEKPPAQATEKPPAEATENPAAEPTPSPTPGSGDNSGGTSPWLILLVIALGIGLVAALYALYRSRNP